MFVITGGSSGIGAQLAKTLALRNQKVLIVGRRKNALESVASFSPLISFVVSDISTQEGRHHLVDKLHSLKKLEGLIHNAGIIEPIKPLEKISENDWHHILETNLNAPLFLSQALLNLLQGGRVLHIGSGAAYFPVQGWAGYCVSKAALSMLNRCWQLESTAIAFAYVLPGIIDTAMQDLIRHAASMDKTKLAFFHRLKHENKLLSQETVAHFLTWLLLDVKISEFGKEWDIYDTAHHKQWLIPPYTVPPLD